jgi:hypothetical protein
MTDFRQGNQLGFTSQPFVKEEAPEGRTLCPLCSGIMEPHGQCSQCIEYLAQYIEQLEP